MFTYITLVEGARPRARRGTPGNISKRRKYAGCMKKTQEYQFEHGT